MAIETTCNYMATVVGVIRENYFIIRTLKNELSWFFLLCPPKIARSEAKLLKGCIVIFVERCHHRTDSIGLDCRQLLRALFIWM